MAPVENRNRFASVRTPDPTPFINALIAGLLIVAIACGALALVLEAAR